MNYTMKTKPFAHQERVFEESKDEDIYAVLWEMGLGKSKLILDTAGHLFAKAKIDGLVIIAPKGVYQAWYYDQIPIHINGTYFSALYCSAPRKQERKDMEAVFTYAEGLSICLINVEALSGSKAQRYLDLFLSRKTCMMVVDESTAIKNWSAKRTKAIVRAGRKAKYRRILTGTPVTQGPLDLFAQYEFLQRKVLGFPTWTAFKNYYAVQQTMKFGSKSFVKVVGYRNIDELQASVKPFTSLLKKVDCLDLPEKLYSTRYVELSPAQKKAYNELRELAVTLIANETITTTSAMTAMLKFQQIVCGHCKTEAGFTVFMQSDRVKLVEEIIEELACDAKVVIFCAFQGDVRLLTDALRAKYGERSTVQYFGPTKQDERQQAIARFQMEEECRFFIATSAGSKGITLTAANTTIYYSNSFSLETRLQSEDRTHRIGQTQPCHYIDIVARKTVDEHVIKALLAKNNLANDVTGALRDVVALGNQ